MENTKRNTLVSLRKNKNWTQRDLAEIMQVSQQAVSEWEQGTRSPTFKKAKKLADLFETPIESFL
ncbi:helix-turn-helix transcriptional regulator [Lysinibacillus sp. NPDC093216]|uniref:helix-turn-helix transcriptional regulator n=1 Tax=Lysinibacillus sp. NPDC093216 TaxID=3390576 RepID=UPI003CFC1158